MSTYYKPIDSANVFINKIFSKYDNSFNAVRVYGTPTEPMFIARDVYGILNDKDLDDIQIKKNLSKVLIYYDEDPESNCRELIRDCPLEIEINRDSGKYKTVRKINVFTKHGLYRCIFTSNKPIADIFRKFVYIVLDELEAHGKVELKDAISKLNEELKRSHDKFEEMSQRRYIEYSTNLKLLKEHRQIDTYKYHINQLKKADSDPNLAREIAIDAYQTQYGKPLVMYLVDHKHIEELLVKALNKGRKKDTKVELEELREDYDLPTYANYDIDFESLSPMRIKHYIANSANAVDDELMYFVFGKFGSKALKQSEHIKTWTTLYFINDQHYREFVKSIDEFQLSNLVEVKDKTISKTYIAASCEILLKHASALGGVAWAFVNKKPSTAEPAGQADSDEDVI